MKSLLALLLIAFTPFSFAKADISTFHRLVVLNDQQEILMVKIKDVDFWVTPGWYQDDDTDIQQGLQQLAADHGIRIDTPKLSGIFTLRGADNKIFSLRNLYVAHAQEMELTLPDNIAEARWEPLPKALKLMTFPHINLMLAHTLKHPNQVWSGSIQRFKENQDFKAKVVTPFYPLTR